jgi:hypothetical protein
MVGEVQGTTVVGSRGLLVRVRLVVQKIDHGSCPFGW